MNRIGWLDTARGGSILLVVAYHATLYAAGYDFDVGIFEKINAALNPIRMPLFFSVSGILAAKAMTMPWPAFLAKRIWLYAYLFGVWLTLRWVFFGAVLENVLTPNEGHSLLELITAWFRPESTIWFLWALMIFYFVGRSFSQRGRTPLLCISVVLSVMAFGKVFVFDTQAYYKALCYAPFFFGAAYYRDYVVRPVDENPKLLLVWSAVAFATLFVVGSVVPPPIDGLFLLARSVAGVTLAFSAAALLQHVRLFNAGLSYLGRNTLPIYVGHIMVVAVVCYALSPWAGRSATDLLIVPIATVIGVAMTLAIKLATDAIGVRYLYAAPELRSSPQPGPLQMAK